MNEGVSLVTLRAAPDGLERKQKLLQKLNNEAKNRSDFDITFAAPR